MDSTMPKGAPALVKLAHSPRRDLACSADISTAPPHSPPTAKAQQHQHDRRPAADLRVRREHADEEADRAHQRHRRHQHPLAAEPVAEVPEDHAAEGTCQIARGERAEAGDGTGERIEAGEEDLAEDEGGGGGVEEEVVVLDDAADEARGHRAAQLGTAAGEFALAAR
ncbi:hypothetical protein [Streptomyces sp. HNM0575]|uniref:hypothetical protein n=1 Tax=Streptomyces sp. HNM0575 TaxID=2716338 RepID=UPI0019D16166